MCWNVSLFVCLPEAETWREKQRKQPVNKNQQAKRHRKILNWPFTFSFTFLLEKKGHFVPIIYPVTETFFLFRIYLFIYFFCFWQITEKKNWKKALYFMYMNKWTPSESKKKKKIPMIALFYTWLLLENKMKTAVVITFFFLLPR